MATRERVVVAVGDGALLGHGGPERVAYGYEALTEISKIIAHLIEEGRDVVITHSNGPQLGAALLRSDLAREALPDVPFDVCGADTQGTLGYLLGQALGNEFKLRGIHRSVATVLTRVEVDPRDAAFFTPSCPVGPPYTEEEANARADEEGWDIAEAPGHGWRRVVATPKPRRIIELDIIRTLVEAGYVVVCCGGGGVPVVLDERGWYMGVAAIVDVSDTSALLARELGASVSPL